MRSTQAPAEPKQPKAPKPKADVFVQEANKPAKSATVVSKATPAALSVQAKPVAAKLGGMKDKPKTATAKPTAAHTNAAKAKAAPVARATPAAKAAPKTPANTAQKTKVTAPSPAAAKPSVKNAATAKKTKAPQTKKTIAVARKSAAPKAQPVRIAEISDFADGSIWRMSGRHGVAYVTNLQLAGELLAIDPKNLAKHAMAIYYDRKGKAYAWQVRFDTDRWEEVTGRMR